MAWLDFHSVAIFLATLVAGALSGMAGGGGGFIITPAFIALGLTPQQAIATAKLGGLGLDVGSITAFRGKIKVNERFTFYLTLIAVVTGAASAFFIRHLQNQHLQLFMGLLILIMVPFVLIRHHQLKNRKRHNILRGFGLLVLIAVLLLQGTFSSGIGSLLNVVLIVIFGFSALQASMMKRQASIVMDLVMIAVLLGSGLINYHFGLIAMTGSAIGGFIGSRFAVTEGEAFVRYALIALMLVSGIWLIATA
jgi:uncharacterized membrane protein YfcA